LTDTSPEKKSKLIDALLRRPEYADFWANKWADLLRPNPYRVGIKAVFNLDAWLRDAFRQNKPYDQFVRELLTAKGRTFRKVAPAAAARRFDADGRPGVRPERGAGRLGHVARQLVFRQGDRQPRLG